MARYIDANLLLQQVAHINSTVEQGVKYFNSVYNLIQKQPAADVVEVVRCKDCIYWWRENELCIHSKCCHDRTVAVVEAPPTHFCSYGERK